MKTTVRIVALSALTLATAQTSFAQRTLLPSEGKILFWDNGRAMEGDITREGDRYRVRRKLGELWLPAARVKFVCDTWEEALAHMRSRANLLDPDERLRLANWCHVNGRHAEAIREIKEALRMRPGHGPSLHLLHMAQRAVEINKRPAVTPKPAPSELPAFTLDLNAESIGVFVTKVQPVLMNTCARCHAGQKNGGFHLRRIFGNGPGSRHSTRHNLAAVMKQIDLQRPVLSPLLIKAISPHGSTDYPPIKSRGSPPYRILKEWIAFTLENNPHLKTHLADRTAGQNENRDNSLGNILRTSFDVREAIQKPPVVRPSQGNRTTTAPTGFASLRPVASARREIALPPGGAESSLGKAPNAGRIAAPPNRQPPTPATLQAGAKTGRNSPGSYFARIGGESPAPKAEPIDTNPVRTVPRQRQPVQPRDEFDANIFNWRNHPQRMSEVGKRGA